MIVIMFGERVRVKSFGSRFIERLFSLKALKQTLQKVFINMRERQFNLMIYDIRSWSNKSEHNEDDGS